MPLCFAQFPTNEGVGAVLIAYKPPSGPHIPKTTQSASRSGLSQFANETVAVPRLRVRQTSRNVLLLCRRGRARRLRAVRRDPLNRVGNGSDRVALGVRPVLEAAEVSLGYNPVTPFGVPSPVRKS